MFQFNFLWQEIHLLNIHLLNKVALVFGDLFHSILQSICLFMNDKIKDDIKGKDWSGWFE